MAEAQRLPSARWWWQRPSEVGACGFAGAGDAEDVGDELVARTLVERTGVER